MLDRLVAVAGPDAGTSFAVGDGGAIGRGRECAIRLADASVSREHARIERQDGAAVVIDLGSTNRTRVNDELIDRWILQPGDRISLGATVLQYVPPDGGLSEVEQANALVTVELERAGDGSRLRGWLDSMTALGDAIADAKDPAQAAQRAAEVVRTTLRATRVVVLRADASGWTRPVAAAGTPSSVHVAASREILGRVAAGSALSARDGALAMALAPMGDGGIVYGERDADFDADEVALLAAAARMIRAGLDASGTRGRLERSMRALENRHPGELLGESAAMTAVRDFVGKAGPTDATVLLLGESGAGKELVAWAIHRAGPRRDGPFVAANCAALADALVDSELFGHEKGAFTGAVERRAGRFEQADGGTLFLDELGELPLAQQAKLLRVLEARRFERVGGTQPVAVDVRVVAATNRDLAAQVRAGAFRADLYYRLGVLVGHVPALRERREDIPVLARHFLAWFSTRARSRDLSVAGAAALAAHDWPGNVRELRNTIERLVILGDDGTIEAEEVVRAIGVAATAPSAVAPSAGSLDDLEKEAIVAALAACAGNKVHAARRLGIDRTTLYKKLKRYGLA